jgi:broad specificity phosphatase PhoE
MISFLFARAFYTKFEAWSVSLYIDTMGFLSAQAFQDSVAHFFKRPSELVFGSETAEQALRRFATAIEQVLNTYTQGNVVVVAHGTVISLFVGAQTDIDPYRLWQRLGLPSFVVLSLPTFELVEVVERIVLD